MLSSRIVILQREGPPADILFPSAGTACKPVSLRRRHDRCVRLAKTKAGQPSTDHIKSRRKYQSERGDADHAGKHRSTERLPELGARARGPDQRQDAKDEGE